MTSVNEEDSESKAMGLNKPEKGHQNSPTPKKEESKERCTFCSALLPLPELVLHVPACSKTSAMTDTDSGNPESIQEACPYCASYFDVLALVEHVNHCKNLSIIKAEEISREDISPSSHEELNSDVVPRRMDDFSLSDKELCPKCSVEFSLLELLDHADKCKGEKPRTSSAEFLQRDDHDHLDADDDACGSSDRHVWLSDETCDENYNDSYIIDRTGNKDDGGSDFTRSEDDDEESDDDDNRRIEEDDDIINGNGDHNGSCSDEENNILSSIYRDNGGIDEDEVDDLVYGDSDIHLSDDESNMCNDDEWNANMSHSSDDENVDATETSEDGAESEEFEICPSCRKLFRLTHLIEHSSKCPAVSSDVKTSMESETEFYGTSTSSESSAATPIVFRDCNFCGLRLSVHLMGIHYPRCRKKYATNDDKNDKHPTSSSGDSSPSLTRTEVTGSAGYKIEANEFKGISSKRTHSSLDSYHDCEEQCMYCLKMFPVSVLVEHASNCATVNKAATEELEQCCYCRQTFPLSELINHAPNCEQKTVSNSQEHAQDEVSTNSQSSSRELLERCMYCFKDFPVSKLIRHSQRCDGDMSGPRERFQGFLPSVHDLSAISSVAKLNDTQRAALQYVISLSAQDSRKVSSDLRTRVKGLGYSESDLTRTLQWVRSAAPIIIHINLDKVLRFFVKDTHYRNQFETGTSGGSKNLTARRSWEDRIFNDLYKHSSPSERVKYGVLNIVGDPRGVGRCAQYGDSFLQLKKVRLRTTFASMDTSAAEVKLSCCEHYENVLFAYSDSEIKAIIDVATGKAPFHLSDCISRYKEVQIHGPLSLSENVECIVVNGRHQGDPQITSLLNLFLERNKCNLIWMEPDDLAGAAPSISGTLGSHSTAGSLSGSRATSAPRRRSKSRRL